MAETIVGVIAPIIEQLSSGAYKKIKLATNRASYMKKLHDLKITIEAVLRDARSLESWSNVQTVMFERLECVLADIDDFLDVKAAKAKQKEVMEGNKFTKEMSLFFSKSNQLVSPFKDAEKFNAIIERTTKKMCVGDQKSGFSRQLGDHWRPESPWSPTRDHMWSPMVAN